MISTSTNNNNNNKITKEMRYDQLTPISVYRAIAGEKQSACMMESAYDEGYGTFSFIGINPVSTFKARVSPTSSEGHEIEITQAGKTESFSCSEIDIYKSLEKFSRGHRVFGLVTYDAVRLKEKIPNRHVNYKKIPDFLFHIYQTVLRFDHKHQKLLITHAGTEGELDALIQKIFQPVVISQFNTPVSANLVPDVSDSEFIEQVKTAQEYIKSGDIFQVVLSRSFKGKTKVKPFDFYRALRQLSPTPYLSFFDEPEFAIASASPELLVGVKNNIIESIPIAGTCRLGEDIQKLLADPKENAEHVMLVDLARNDVGSVAVPGSVQVTEYKTVRAYSHVSHLISRVIGQINPAYTPLDVLKASLPAGTLSGAPKIRAMEIIDELETTRRSLYGGALVTIDELGNLTSAIAIRTAYFENGEIEIRAGAGIVLDSIPEKEAQETKLKAQGAIAALELALSL